MTSAARARENGRDIVGEADRGCLRPRYADSRDREKEKFVRHKHSVRPQ